MIQYIPLIKLHREARDRIMLKSNNGETCFHYNIIYNNVQTQSKEQSSSLHFSSKLSRAVSKLSDYVYRDTGQTQSSTHGKHEGFYFAVYAPTGTLSWLDAHISVVFRVHPSGLIQNTQPSSLVHHSICSTTIDFSASATKKALFSNFRARITTQHQDPPLYPSIPLAALSTIPV